MSCFKVAMVALDPSLLPMPEWLPQRLDNCGVEFEYRECESDADLEQFAADAHLVWVMGGSRIVTASNIHTLRCCRAILRSGSGTDNIPVAEATRLGIMVLNTPQAICDAVADHAIGLLFAAFRQIAIHDRLVRQGVWDRTAAWPRWHLQGQTLGLVGFGWIARTVARKLSGFEPRLLVFDPFVDPAVLVEHRAEAVDLNRLLEESDVVSIHCPLMPATHHLIGERELRRMKPTAILINTSRGPVIDEPALVRALSEKWIAAAGLDVLETEPPPADHPLTRLDNVVLTPHIAGYSDIFKENFWRFSVEAIEAMAQNRRPPSIVNPTVQPRFAGSEDRIKLNLI